MSTLNGVGTVYYGQEQTRDDQSYVATRFFVIFFIPILPLGTVRMRNLRIDGASNDYEILERLPMRWAEVRKTYLRGWLLLPLVLLWPIMLLLGAVGVTHAFYGKAATSRMMASVAPIAIGVFAVYFIAMAAQLVRRVRTRGLLAPTTK